MQSTEIATVAKMMESLPEPAQKQVVEYLRHLIEDLQDEEVWDALVERTQPKLTEAARRARQQIAEGLSQPLDANQL
jgi:hypothetical protein